MRVPGEARTHRSGEAREQGSREAAAAEAGVTPESVPPASPRLYVCSGSVPPVPPTLSPRNLPLPPHEHGLLRLARAAPVPTNPSLWAQGPQPRGPPCCSASPSPPRLAPPSLVATAAGPPPSFFGWGSSFLVATAAGPSFSGRGSSFVLGRAARCLDWPSSAKGGREGSGGTAAPAGRAGDRATTQAAGGGIVLFCSSPDVGIAAVRGTSVWRVHCECW